MKSMFQVRGEARAKIAQQMRELSDALSAGRAGNDIGLYNRYVGRIHGMKEALDAIDETFKSVLDEHDNDEGV